MNYSLRVYFSGVKFINMPRKRFGRTIYVSNHASSFMDPIVIAGLTRPIVFFMTRSDVFTRFSSPFLWASQMLPIYRQHDGEDTRKKNDAVFDSCSKILSFGRNLLIFGEGFTDDVFVRRLKTVKKGAVRIGFTSLEKINWKKKIYIAAVGCNYTDPNRMRSDLLISYSDKICLNDYKKEYLENPSKVINDLTKRIESMMQAQITHNKNIDFAPFHEHIMMLTRKGMNGTNYDSTIPLKERWQYSQKLATWLNDISRDHEEIHSMKNKVANYNIELAENDVDESMLHWKRTNPKGGRSLDLLKIILLFPFAIIGTIHCVIPYLFTKRFVEKTMKRPVFWGSVKIILGMFTIALFNAPIIFIIYYFIISNWWIAIAYFFSIGLTGFTAYIWTRIKNEYLEKGRVNQLNLTSILSKRESIETELKNFLPKEFH